ncbi:MAG: hypothetical protein BGO11_00425 [Solirubrobacterales bacterium 70-9]|nr:MAG: hypothetical protein BGO11_00425 [Solirubrobacterales bacterium 70-9]
MQDRRSEDRLYSAILMAFLVALVLLGLLGVPAPLVAAIGIAAAAFTIALFHGRIEAGSAAGARQKGKRSHVPAKYAPSVLEGSSMRRKRGFHLRRRHHANPPLRFR